MKDKTTAAILALFLGSVGIHKFYLGNTAAGVLYLAFCWTFIPGFLALIDFLVLALMDGDEFNRRYNRALAAPVTVNMLPPHAGGFGFHAPGHPGAMHPGAMHPGAMHGYPGMHHGAPPPGFPQAASPVPHPPAGLDPEELGRRLEKLNELRISGLLTEEEFSAQKARLLSQM